MCVYVCVREREPANYSFFPGECLCVCNCVTQCKCVKMGSKSDPPDRNEKSEKTKKSSNSLQTKDTPKTSKQTKAKPKYKHKYKPEPVLNLFLSSMVTRCDTSRLFSVVYYEECGQVAQAARRWATGWTARVRSRVSEGWRFFFAPSCPDWS